MTGVPQVFAIHQVRFNLSEQNLTLQMIQFSHPKSSQKDSNGMNSRPTDQSAKESLVIRAKHIHDNKMKKKKKKEKKDKKKKKKKKKKKEKYQLANSSKTTLSESNPNQLSISFHNLNIS